MNKKEFYEAPEWGMRVVMVERHYLTTGSDFSDQGTEISPEDPEEDLG